MRPEAFKKIDFDFVKKNSPKSQLSWAATSFTLLYVNLFCFSFFSVSVLSTHKRVALALQEISGSLPPITKFLLRLTSYDYMTFCVVLGVMLIGKERMKDKKLSFIINLAMVIFTLGFTYFYIWGMSLPFKR
jgi:hypothetical protein